MVDINKVFSILTKSKSEQKKKKAQIDLKNILRRKSIPELNRLMKTFSHVTIKHKIELEIWQRKLDRTPKNLLKIIHQEVDEDKICEAITELGRQKIEDAIGIFIDLLKSKSSSIRTRAAQALLNNPNQKAFRPLIMAIKKHRENCSAFVHALEVLDCNTATEFLVDLFILKSNAPMVRINIIECFEGDAIGKIPPKIGKRIATKIFKGIRKSKDGIDKYEMRRFYEEVVEQKIEKQKGTGKRTGV